MDLRRKYLIAILIVVLVAITHLAIGRALDYKKYSVLEDAVIAESFDSELNKPVHTTVECYPNGKSSTCLALSYGISLDACHIITEKIVGKMKKDKSCEYYQSTKEYSGHDVQYIITKNDYSYRLMVVYI